MRRRVMLALMLSVTISLTGVTATVQVATEQDRTVTSVEETLDYSAMEKVAPLETPPDSDDFSQWICAAKNNTFTLYLNPATTGFALQTADGYVWRSNPAQADDDPVARGTKKAALKSQLIITYAEKDEESATLLNSFAGSTNKGDFELYLDENGYVAVYNFEKPKLRLPVRYALEDDGLKVTALTGLAEETGTAQLLSVALLPYMGASTVNDEGYMLVPDGMGALISFNNGKFGKFGAYTQKVYSRNRSLFTNMDEYVTQEISLPVFGNKFNNNAYLAVIEDSAIDATLKAEMGGNLSIYNALYSEFSVRSADTRFSETFQSERFIQPENAALPDCVSVRYLFLYNADGIDYTDMADCYRARLMTSQGMRRQETPNTSLVLDIYGAAVETKTIIAVTVDTTRTLTTFDQAQTILSELKEKGVEDIWLNFYGWSKESVRHTTLKKLRFDQAVGNEKAFRALNAYCVSNSIPVCYNAELLSTRSSAPFSQFTDYAKNILSQPVKLYPYSLDTHFEDKTQKPLYLLSYQRIAPSALAYAEQMAKKGASGVMLQDVAQLAYSDYGDKAANMTGLTTAINQAVSGIRERLDWVAVKEATDQLLPFADMITDAPSQSSRFDIADYEVPFYQMVVHGLVPYALKPINSTPNPTDMFLQSVSLGALPGFQWTFVDTAALKGTDLENLFGASYSDWIDRAADMARRIRPVLEKGNQFITAFSCPMPGVTETIYEDGSRVTVNFNNTDIVWEGHTIPAKDFRLTER